MAISNVTKVKNILGALVDSAGKKRDGSIIVRRGFYYRNGQDAESYKIAVCKKLNESSIKYSIKDYGEHFTSFRGGASIANQSHWFVEIWMD